MDNIFSPHNDNYQTRGGFTYVATLPDKSRDIKSIKGRGWFLECVTEDGKTHRIMKNTEKYTPVVISGDKK